MPWTAVSGAATLFTFTEVSRALAGWIQSGQLKYRETIAEGIESAPAAFRGLLAGRNFGKQLVRLVG